jgi:hypothetical protein
VYIVSKLLLFGADPSFKDMWLGCVWWVGQSRVTGNLKKSYVLSFVITIFDDWHFQFMICLKKKNDRDFDDHVFFSVCCPCKYYGMDIVCQMSHRCAHWLEICSPSTQHGMLQTISSLLPSITHRPRGLPKPRIAQIPGNSVRRQTTGRILCSIMLLGC